MGHAKKFYNRDHITSYLTNSLVMHEKYPFFVREIGDSERNGYYQVYGRHTHKLEPTTVLSSKELNCTSPRLGYVYLQNSKKTYSVMRMPSRNWKVGLTHRNMFVFSPTGYEQSGRIDYRDLLTSSSLGRAIMGNFIPYEKARDKLVKDAENFTRKQGIAFDRNFMVMKTDHGDPVLMNSHHFTPIGKVDDNGEPVLHEKYSYLKELLEKALKK